MSLTTQQKHERLNKLDTMTHAQLWEELGDLYYQVLYIHSQLGIMTNVDSVDNFRKFVDLTHKEQLQA